MNMLSSTGEATLLFPKENLIIRMTEGTGDNLLREDEREGFVDYFNWDSYNRYGVSIVALMRNGWDEFEDDASDGGMAFFKEYIPELTDDALVEALKYQASISADSPYTLITTA